MQEVEEKKRKVLITADEWLCPSLALSLQTEGCDVYAALKRPTTILKGTIKRIPYADRIEFAKGCDLVIYEDKSNRGEPAILRKMGLSVIGGDKLSDKLELDRIWANKMAKLSGLLVPEIHKTDDFDKVRAIIKEKGGKWVLKQQGKIDEIKGLNFVAKMPNSEDLLDFLDFLDSKWIDGLKKDFVLQERIDGHEMAVGSYWNGKEFMKDSEGNELCEENFEHKSLMTGNMGESTGEMFTVMRYMKAKHSKLFMETLDKYRPLLKAMNFRGDIDINCIVTEKGAFFLENTPRMGVPATSGQLEIHKSSWYTFLKAMADGKQDKKFAYDPKPCVVSWLYTKPFPFVNSHKMTAVYEKLDASSAQDVAETLSFRMSNSNGIIVNLTKDFTTDDWKHVHPDGLRFQDKKLKIANEDGYVLTASATGETVEAAGEKVAAIFKKIIVPKAFYRNDFSSSNFHKASEDLNKWGYVMTAEAKEKMEKDEAVVKEVAKEAKRKRVREKLKKIVV